MMEIPGSASSLVLGFLLATIYGGVFHVVFGGSIRRILLYLAAAWAGFFIGQFVGDFLNFELLKLGKLHLVSASIGAWLALFGVWWLMGQEPGHD
ncbi:MAG: hypothetical protein LC131_08485 [Anaerolineae bacterium]|nr:hypothetical protein [Promineifilum sp.]MCZ2113857.1 hypothetical protein [Anaerolineae bacterium]